MSSLLWKINKRKQNTERPKHVAFGYKSMPSGRVISDRKQARIKPTRACNKVVDGVNVA